MKTIAELFDLSQIKHEKKQQDAITEETATVINWLFKELRSNCPAFMRAWPTTDLYQAAKRTWLKAFMLAGINTIEQLQHGLNRCYLQEKPFVPSPGEFISWCTPKLKDLGLPELEEAYALSNLINRQFSGFKPDCQKTYTVIKHAIDQIGSLNYRSMKAETAFKSFERYYSIACKQFAEGRLKSIPKAIADPIETNSFDRQRSDEARLRAMDALRKLGLPIAQRPQSK